jgi:hypothetical protein
MAARHGDLFGFESNAYMYINRCIHSEDFARNAVDQLVSLLSVTPKFWASDKLRRRKIIWQLEFSMAITL